MEEQWIRSVASGRPERSQDSLAPPPHAGHQPCHALQWDGVPLFDKDLSQFSQCRLIRHSCAYSTTKLVPQMLNRVQVRAVHRPLHPRHSLLLQVFRDDPRSVWAGIIILEDGVWSEIAQVWDDHWPKNVVPISLGVQVSINDDQLCLPLSRNATPHHDTAPSKRCDSIDACSSQQSVHHHDATLSP